MRSALAASNTPPGTGDGERPEDRRRAIGAAVVLHGALLLGLLAFRLGHPATAQPAQASRAPMEVVTLAPLQVAQVPRSQIQRPQASSRSAPVPRPRTPAATTPPVQKPAVRQTRPAVTPRPVCGAWTPALTAMMPGAVVSGAAVSGAVAPGPLAAGPESPLPSGRGWPGRAVTWPGGRAGRPADPAAGPRAAPRRPRWRGGDLRAALRRQGRAECYLLRVPSASRSPPAFLMMSITCTTAP